MWHLITTATMMIKRLWDRLSLCCKAYEKEKKIKLSIRTLKAKHEENIRRFIWIFSARFSKPRIHIKNAHFLSKVGTLIGKK